MDQMFKLSGKGEPSLAPSTPDTMWAKFQGRPPTASRYVGCLRPLAMSVARSSTDHDAGDAADLISTL
jgi:hypothetical protein